MKIFDDTGKLYFVGGVVRDELLGRESFDVDIVFEGNAIEHCAKFGEVVRVNPDFGTVRVNVDGVEVDFASTRSETYPRAGHLPVVDKIGCSLKEDVLRRDFTVNALAKSVKTDEIVDYTGGLADIEAKVLRVLHERSFIDDPTRIIRALKFSVRFGFALESNTQRLQEEYLANINYDMCFKRIKKEVMETFNLNSQEAFERFYDGGIYKLLSPVTVERPRVNVPEVIAPLGVETPWIVYAGGADLSRLELTKQEQRVLSDFETLKSTSLGDDFEIYKAFSAVAAETRALYAVWVAQAPVQRFMQIKDIKISITGADLLALGIKPSKQYAEIFDAVLREKLKNPNMTKDEEIKFLLTL
ncbi:MAG: hypothetical protein NC390_07655 [Fusobacterium sp.]|nr:hypothetical protein [Fusobacterium sp.]